MRKLAAALFLVSSILVYSGSAFARCDPDELYQKWTVFRDEAKAAQDYYDSLPEFDPEEQACKQRWRDKANEAYQEANDIYSLNSHCFGTPKVKYDPCPDARRAYKRGMKKYKTYNKWQEKRCKFKSPRGKAAKALKKANKKKDKAWLKYTRCYQNGF